MAFTQVTIAIICAKAKVGSNGIMGRFTKENGKQEERMDTEFGEATMVIVMKDSGQTEGKRELEPESTKTTFIKENS